MTLTGSAQFRNLLIGIFTDKKLMYYETYRI